MLAHFSDEADVTSLYSLFFFSIYRALYRVRKPPSSGLASRFSAPCQRRETTFRRREILLRTDQVPELSIVTVIRKEFKGNEGEKKKKKTTTPRNQWLSNKANRRRIIPMTILSRPPKSDSLTLTSAACFYSEENEVCGLGGKRAGRNS